MIPKINHISMILRAVEPTVRLALRMHTQYAYVNRGKMMRTIKVFGVSLLCMCIGWFYLNLAYFMPVQSVIVHGYFDDMGVENLQKRIQSWQGLHMFWRVGALQQTLSQDPWFNKVQVKRRFPDTLALYLDVRTPVLRWSDQHALLDSYGVVMPVPVPDHLMHLPIVDAPRSAHSKAYSLWQHLQRVSPVWKGRLNIMQMGSFGDWDCVFNNQVRVKLGNSHLIERLQLFLRVAELWHLVDDVRPQVFDMRYNGSFTHKLVQGENQK